MNSWVEMGDRVLVRRHVELDLSIGLVVGAERCLVVDSRGDPAQGAELARAVREVTALPWTVVLTHAHFDHCLGTAALLPAQVWAHRGCHADLARGGHAQHVEALEWYRSRGRPGTVARTAPVLPDRLVDDRAELDLGGRRVVLTYLGAGHTDHDLVIGVPDTGVLFAGDLVEQGAPPAFSDAYPQQWPGALTRLLALGPTTVVPGHGEPVDAAFVATQRDEFVELAQLCREVREGRCGAAAAVARSPFDAVTTRHALARPGNPGAPGRRPRDGNR